MAIFHFLVTLHDTVVWAYFLKNSTTNIGRIVLTSFFLILCTLVLRTWPLHVQAHHTLYRVLFYSCWAEFDKYILLRHQVLLVLLFIYVYINYSVVINNLFINHSFDTLLLVTVLQPDQSLDNVIKVQK